MPSPIDEVLAFFAEWVTVDRMREAMRDRFTPETVWENVGIATTIGIEQGIAFSDGFLAQFGVARGEVVIDHIAASGQSVLTERSDIFYDAAGTQLMSIKLMGILEMDGPRILRWRDYCDTKGAGF